MQETSALYRQIMAETNHWFETSVVIGDSGILVTERGDKLLFGGTAIIVARSGPDSGFLENKIFSVRTSIQMFQEDPTIGRAVSQEIELKLLNPAGEIPQMGVIVPYVRVCSTTAKSEWIQQGVFYIDTREISKNHDSLQTLTLHGYDAMLMTEQDWTDSGRLDWSSGFVTDTDMVQDIATTIGINVDERTWDVMDGNYPIPAPLGYTLREVLGYIAASYAGCFIISDIGELRLVSILEMPPESSLLIDNIGDYITFGGDRIKV